LETQKEKKNKHTYEPVSKMEFLEKSGWFLVAKPPFFRFLHKPV
jgi:hypothetical protein